MVEQMRHVEITDDVESYHIDGQPFNWSEGDIVALPRPVAHNLVRQNNAVYQDDVYEVDSEDFDEELGPVDDEDELDMTVSDLRDYVEDVDDPEQLDELESYEEEHKDRTTSYDVIDGRRDELDE